ncbi:MAG: tyrosine-type recombinase/integrase [Bacteroidetes bacterium]|uniref:tyrosine-type recombinase/integrase n=1 Tax=uncultured Comamonas sp. TaxID=114710 RepID=UPI0026041712|nr:site-specific integrase [uncultured Comamonas sp.]MBS1942175.1 tyrosine-type recombinase/integrase [Bacteroidota bacterium]
MAKTKLTKSAVDAAQPQAQPVELRDTLVPGFLCKVTPAGRKVFMLQYRTNAGERRKPAIGLYGELTVEQARSLAQEWLAEVRRGGDPGAAKTAARKAPTVAELCDKFMEEHSKQRNKPSTQAGYQKCIRNNIIPMLGRMKVQDVKRPDVAGAMKKMAHKPADANRTFSVMRKMFNLAEVWGYRPDGTNPCRHVPMYPNGKATHLISDEEMGKLFRYLDFLETDGLGLDHAVLPLAIRLQFEFAGRRSEVVTLQWDWVDLEHRRVVWPDSKTGGMSKPLSEEAWRLLSAAPRHDDCPHVFPSPNHPGQHMTTGEYYGGWTRILKRAGVSHVGTHGIRHRSATDIANSGIPVKVGMALTAHKTVAMFMRYVHTEDKPVREAAELVAQRRKTVVGARLATELVAAP